MNNPLLEKWETPFEVPPFGTIRAEHFLPAIVEAIGVIESEINAITESVATPTFENTIIALERSGELLSRITPVLFNLNSAETSKDIQKAAMEASPLLTKLSNDITLNDKLFARVRTVYNEQKGRLTDNEDEMLLEKRYLSFRLGGAELPSSSREEFRKMTGELAQACLKFEENVLEETNAFFLHLTEYSDLDGLPDGIKEMAAAEAESRKIDGWVFTLQYPSYIPFMQYSSRRNLREKMLKAYSSRAFNGGDSDNRELVKKIVNLRLSIARMLGFDCYADMALSERMADNKKIVSDFLDDLFKWSHRASLRDFNNVLDFASKEGHHGDFERWDWAYWSERLKKTKYDIDDEILKPYFRLENVEKAIFDLANTLYGIRFIPDKTIPVYHSEVKTFHVVDEQEKHLAVFMTDYHPRPGKSGGAWMTTYRDQKKTEGADTRPVVSIVTNFSRPTPSAPSLLTFNELTTFLHEFGHSLHAIFSDCRYESLSGTNVPRDFVELPSQIMENWAFEKEWLEKWAVHHLTGEIIPFRLIEKIKESSTFNEGYACDRQLSFCFLDMGWHTLTTRFDGDINEFESGIMQKTSLLPPIPTANMSCSFTHLFGGGYAAGYYGYKWAEVLDADAFSLFKETGIFNKKTAASFRHNILERGYSSKPGNLYLKFRGKEPSLNALLERSGLKSNS
ncbi:MAG: M3 family metallopeptidase [Bacteroidales bacterium]